MRLARVHTAQTLPEAAVLVSMLAARDVYAHPVGYFIAGSVWTFVLAMGGMPVLVSEEDAGDAILLIRSPVATPELFESRAFRKRLVLNSVITVLLVLGLGIYCPYWVRRAEISDWQE